MSSYWDKAYDALMALLNAGYAVVRAKINDTDEYVTVRLTGEGYDVILPPIHVKSVEELADIFDKPDIHELFNYHAPQWERADN